MKMQTQTIRFTEHRLTARKKIRCTECGRSMNRQTTFTETDNPWNRNDDGSQKTVGDIYRSLQAKCDAWMPPEETCSKCRSAS